MSIYPSSILSKKKKGINNYNVYDEMFRDFQIEQSVLISQTCRLLIKHSPQHSTHRVKNARKSDRNKHTFVT